MRQGIASETDEEREARLEQMRQRIASETDEEREARLERISYNRFKKGNHPS